MNSVDLVISRFGGIRKTARALDMHASSVLRWKKSGTVPLHRWMAVLCAAKQHNVQLDLMDLAQQFGVALTATPVIEPACNSETTNSTSSTGHVAVSPVIVEP